MLYGVYRCGHKRRLEQEYHGKKYKGVKSVSSGELCSKCKTTLNKKRKAKGLKGKI